MQLLSYCLVLFGLLCSAVALFAWMPFMSKDMRLDLVGVVFLLGLGSVTYLIGVTLEKYIKPPRPKTYVLKPGDTRFIGAMLSGAARGQLIFGLTMVSLGGGFLLLFPTADEMKNSPGYPMIIVGLSLVVVVLFAAVGLMSLYASYKMRTRDAAIFRDILINTPGEVTALNVSVIQKDGAPGDVGKRFLAEIQAGPQSLTLNVSAKHLALLRQHLQVHGPQAEYRETDWAV